MLCASALLPLTAAGEDSVRLSVPDCEGISGAEIAKLVTLELSPHVQVADDGEVTAAMRCSGARAEISVDDPRRSAPLVLSLQLTEARREARPRLLALAMAELIATSRLERPPPQEPKPKPEDEPLEPDDEDEEDDDEPGGPPGPSTGFWLGGGVVRGLKPTAWSPAIGAGAAHSFGLIELAADLNFEWSSRRTTQADLTTTALSLGLLPGLRLVFGPVTLGIGAGVRAGWARLGATSRDSMIQGGSLSGLFLAPIAQLTTRVAIDPHWQVRLAFELGYVTKAVRGTDADKLRLHELTGMRACGLLALIWLP